MSSLWPALDLSAWSATCDTLHAHTQILGKLAVVLAPPEPQLQHAALRLTTRAAGRRSRCPRPTVRARSCPALDSAPARRRREHSDGRAQHIPLTPDRARRRRHRDVLDAAGIRKSI
jgi:hypothetical protein